MLVSIVIPVYKVENLIERCVRSLFEQSYNDIEYIFVDDKGGDKSIDIVKDLLLEYPSRNNQVKIISHQSNLGSAAARSTGLKASTGDYVIHVDSDDYVDKDYIKKLAEKAIDTGADIVVCDMVFLYRNGKSKLVKSNGSELLSKDEWLSLILSGKEHASLCNKLVRRQIFIDNNIDFNKDIMMYDDKSVLCKVVYFSSKIENVDVALYYYDRTNIGSITNRDNSNAISAATKLMYELVNFFSLREQTRVVQEGFMYFLIEIKGTMIFYTDKEWLNHQLLRRFPIKQILSHPTVPSYYKLVVLCEQFHLSPIVQLLKYLFNRLR